MIIYTIRPNDTLDSIAASYGINAQIIAYDNQIPYPYALAVGGNILLSQAEFVQNEDDILVNSFEQTIHSGGYAYPNISQWVLEQSLPSLTDLFVFSYGFTPEGELIPPVIDDTRMISYALEYGTAPILTLTPFGADGMFNNQLISSLVNNEDAKIRLINEIAAEIQSRGFQGVDVDFEYILSDDRLPFVSFVKELAASVNALGYPVSVALAPKTSDSQTGLLYEGKDYALLGEAADYVLLMTYEWGYTYGPPMAVAPLNKVRPVVEYALTKIPAYKIHLGIPNYGYDWPLPYERGTTKAKTIGHVEAFQLAIQNDAEILFDPIAQSPHFTYTQNDIMHEVWFEDVRSLFSKFSLLQEYGLRGMSYWQIMRLFRAGWLLQNKLFYLSNQ